MNKIITTIGGLPCPVFYPSVSSASKNRWSIIDHIDLLVTTNHPQFLVSCYDIHSNKNDGQLKRLLTLAGEQNQIIIFDSGIYEIVWAHAKNWRIGKYNKTLKKHRFSQAFSFDDYCTKPNKVASTDKIADLCLRLKKS